MSDQKYVAGIREINKTTFEVFKIIFGNHLLPQETEKITLQKIKALKLPESAKALLTDHYITSEKEPKPNIELVKKSSYYAQKHEEFLVDALKKGQVPCIWDDPNDFKKKCKITIEKIYLYHELLEPEIDKLLLYKNHERMVCGNCLTTIFGVQAIEAHTTDKKRPTKWPCNTKKTTELNNDQSQIEVILIKMNNENVVVIVMGADILSGQMSIQTGTFVSMRRCPNTLNVLYVPREYAVHTDMDHSIKLLCAWKKDQETKIIRIDCNLYVPLPLVRLENVVRLEHRGHHNLTRAPWHEDKRFPYDENKHHKCKSTDIEIMNHSNPNNPTYATLQQLNDQGYMLTRENYKESLQAMRHVETQHIVKIYENCKLKNRQVYVHHELSLFATINIEEADKLPPTLDIDEIIVLKVIDLDTRYEFPIVEIGQSIIKFMGVEVRELKNKRANVSFIKPIGHAEKTYERLGTLNQNVIDKFAFPPVLEDITVANKKIKTFKNKALDSDQRQAVNLFMNLEDGFPLIVHGPPGTGKTACLVEMVVQQLLQDPEGKILILTHSNASANELAARLIEAVGSDRVYRLFSRKAGRRIDLIPDNVLAASNCNTGVQRRTTPIIENILMQYQIHIATMGIASEIAQYDFNYKTILLDEGGFAPEDTLMTALDSFVVDRSEIINKRKEYLIEKKAKARNTRPADSYMSPKEIERLETMEQQPGIYDEKHPYGTKGYRDKFFATDLPLKKGIKIVIAGDPFQLGPVVLCQQLDNYPIKKSLLERNMPIYEKSSTHYVPLKTNYRSTGPIVNLFSTIWYNGQVVSKAKNVDQFVGAKFLSDNKNVPYVFVESGGQPIHDVNGPSYRNRVQAKQVAEVANFLVREGIDGILVDPQDIGIVTPYAAQKKLIQDLLKPIDLLDIEVDTVEKYHGREKNVILIFLVRTFMREEEARPQIGFLANEKASIHTKFYLPKCFS